MTYDLHEFLVPFWKAKRIVDESVMLVGDDDAAPLIFTPDKIESVRSSDRKTEYKEGEDFILSDGKIKPLPNSRMPILPLSDFFLDRPAKRERHGEIY